MFAASLWLTAASRSESWGAALLLAASAGHLLAGVVTLPSFRHIAISLVAVLLAASGIALSRRTFARSTPSRSIGALGSIAAPVMLGGVAMLWVLPEWAGVWQRMTLGTAMLWTLALATARLR